MCTVGGRSEADGITATYGAHMVLTHSCWASCMSRPIALQTTSPPRADNIRQQFCSVTSVWTWMCMREREKGKGGRLEPIIASQLTQPEIINPIHGLCQVLLQRVSTTTCAPHKRHSCCLALTSGRQHSKCPHNAEVELKIVRLKQPSHKARCNATLLDDSSIKGQLGYLQPYDTGNINSITQ